MIEIHQHAIQRAMQRIPGCLTEAHALAVLSTPAIEAAARFGAKYVRLGSGHRVVIDQGKVITVLPRDTEMHKMGSKGDNYRQMCRGAVMARQYEEGY